MLYILLVAIVVIGEHYIKSYIEKNKQLGEEEKILKGKITIRKFYNKGAFLNFMENKKELVKTISCVLLGLILLLFAIMLPKKGNKLFKLGLSLALGGAISNVADRVLRGYVVDYFSINYKKLRNVIFNLADIAIFLGSALMTLSTMFSTKNK
ncbi:MAG: putative rane protein [Herbinix sp.]|jgi:signal peptidase II|nr:putative rane protein [Herbinix sp.]